MYSSTNSAYCTLDVGPGHSLQSHQNYLNQNSKGMGRFKNGPSTSNNTTTSATTTTTSDTINNKHLKKVIESTFQLTVPEKFATSLKTDTNLYREITRKMVNNTSHITIQLTVPESSEAHTYLLSLLSSKQNNCMKIKREEVYIKSKVLNGTNGTNGTSSSSQKEDYHIVKRIVLEEFHANGRRKYINKEHHLSTLQIPENSRSHKSNLSPSSSRGSISRSPTTFNLKKKFTKIQNRGMKSNKGAGLGPINGKRSVNGQRINNSNNLLTKTAQPRASKNNLKIPKIEEKNNNKKITTSANVTNRNNNTSLTVPTTTNSDSSSSPPEIPLSLKRLESTSGYKGVMANSISLSRTRNKSEITIKANNKNNSNLSIQSELSSSTTTSSSQSLQKLEISINHNNLIYGLSPKQYQQMLATNKELANLQDTKEYQQADNNTAGSHISSDLNARPIRRSRQNSGLNTNKNDNNTAANSENPQKQSMVKKINQRELRNRNRAKMKNEILNNSHSLTINLRSNNKTPDDEIINHHESNQNSNDNNNLENDRLSAASPKGSSYASSEVGHLEVDLKEHIPEKRRKLEFLQNIRPIQPLSSTLPHITTLKTRGIPKIKLNNRVRQVTSGRLSEWKLTGEPKLCLIPETNHEKQQLHWTFQSVIHKAKDGIRNLKVGDCIIVRAAEEDLPFIAKIQNFWSDSSMGKEDIRATVFWFYRAKDVKAEMKKKNGVEGGSHSSGTTSIKKPKSKNNQSNEDQKDEQNQNNNNNNLILENDLLNNPRQPLSTRQLSQQFQANFYDKEIIRDDQFLNHPNAVYASKHQDTISVASINDKCMILTPAEYFRYAQRCKLLKQRMARDKYLLAETGSSIGYGYKNMNVSGGVTQGFANERGVSGIRLGLRNSCRRVDENFWASHFYPFPHHDLISITNLPTEDPREFDADHITEQLKKRTQPKPTKHGYSCNKSLVFFCPGIYEVGPKATDRRIKKDVQEGKKK